MLLNISNIELFSNLCIQFVFVCLLGLLLYVLVNSYCPFGMVSSPNHNYFLGKFEQAVN